MGAKSKTFPSMNGSLTLSTVNLDALLGAKADETEKYANWSLIDPTVVHSIIWAVCHLGGTAQFGITRNSKAYTLKLYVGKAYDPQYFDGDDEGVRALTALASALVEMATARA